MYLFTLKVRNDQSPEAKRFCARKPSKMKCSVMGNGEHVLEQDTKSQPTPGGHWSCTLTFPQRGQVKGVGGQTNKYLMLKALKIF